MMDKTRMVSWSKLKYQLRITREWQRVDQAKEELGKTIMCFKTIDKEYHTNLIRL